MHKYRDSLFQGDFYLIEGKVKNGPGNDCNLELARFNTKNVHTHTQNRLYQPEDQRHNDCIIIMS